MATQSLNDLTQFPFTARFPEENLRETMFAGEARQYDGGGCKENTRTSKATRMAMQSLNDLTKFPFAARFPEENLSKTGAPVRC